MVLLSFWKAYRTHFYDEIVEFRSMERTKIGSIIELYEDKAVIQVFEGTENMSLDNTRTKLTGHPMEFFMHQICLEEHSMVSDNQLMD